MRKVYNNTSQSFDYFGDNSNDSIIGDAGNNNLWGGAGDDYLNGSNGNDRLEGEAGNDSLWGGEGKDDLGGGLGNDRLEGEAGDDRLWGGEGNDDLGGGIGNDYLNGEAGNDRLWGGDGNDRLDGGSGTDGLFGGLGDDNISGGDDEDRLEGEAGNDVLWGGEGKDDLGGGTGNDGLDGQAGNDRLWGGDGNDDLSGGTGDDYLDGGWGSDRLWGGDGTDDLRAGEGDDQLWGGDGNDEVSGDAGNDKLNGGEGKDRLWGGDGNDELDGNAGNDGLWGGAGDDTISGGDGDDRLEGEAGDDALFGGDGKDDLGGGVGNDRLEGEADNDRLWGGDGNDDLSGGLGDDYLDGGQGNDRLWGGDGADDLRAGEGDDELFGGDGSDDLSGDAGNDKLDGEIGNDRLWGGDGNDQLSGGIGNDYLDGGASKDLIRGGTGNDNVDGGADKDTYYLEDNWDNLKLSYNNSAGSFTFTGQNGGTDNVKNVEVFVDSSNISKTAEELRLSMTDRLAPALINVTPSDDSTNVAVNANIVLNFNENIQAGSGNIYIYNSNGTTAKTINVTDTSQVSFSGSSITINPMSDLAAGSDYYLNITGGAIKDIAGNNYAGISGSATYNFKTATTTDTTAPALISTTPADNSTGVEVGANLTLNFNESIQAGSGNIYIYNSNGTVAKTISVSDASQVSFSGSSVIVNPTTDLAAGTSYYVNISSGAIKDIAGNNFNGISGSAAYNFTTSVPQVSGFNIDISYSGNQSYKTYFDQAASIFQSIITKDLPDIKYNGLSIDDLLISASVTNIDGAGGILGQAAPEIIRTATYLPAKGFMQFDVADVNYMISNGTFGDVVAHEMAHVLGFGTTWKYLGLNSTFGRYTGMNAVAEYKTLSGNSSATFIPLETSGGAGTANSHWSEAVFDREIMTGYAEASGNMPLSRLTIAALKDLGYSVDYSKAEPYFIGMSSVSANYTSPSQSVDYNSIIDEARPQLIIGTDSNDLLNISSADINLNLLDGFDTVVLDGRRSDFKVLKMNDAFQVTNLNNTTAENHLYENIEKVSFKDGSLIFDVASNSAEQLVYRLYQAAFARSPDEGGFRYWAGVAEKGTSFDEISSTFINSSEFKQKYGLNLTNEQCVDLLYKNVLGRSGEAEGVNYWTGELNAGHTNTASVLIEFSASSENVIKTLNNIDNGYWVT